MTASRRMDFLDVRVDRESVIMEHLRHRYALDEEDIAASLLDLLADVEEVRLLLFDNLVDLRVVVHHNLIVHLISRARY